VSSLLLALALWAGGGIAAALLGARRAAGPVGLAGACLGALAALAAGLPALSSAPAAAHGSEWHSAWQVPYGEISLRLDPLAAVFLLPVAVVGALCAIYGAGYLARSAHPRSAGGSFALFDLLLASMALVVTASNLVLFLAGWEAMTLASFGLMVSEHEDAHVRRAGFRYLVAAHLATAALVVLFVLLAIGRGSWEMVAPGSTAVAVPGAILLALLLVGFGTKAGLAPFHVWLPDAHSAAPAHVSALMSGVMVTMGLYGIARFVPLLGDVSLLPAYALIGLGALSACGGIAMALMQRDVKRVLAWSTVENSGLVTLAMGVGLLGRLTGHPLVSALGWTAALFHVWNHALMKALLFQGIGAFAQALGERDLERWGGLLRRWRLVGALVIAGAVAITALPGMNGFASEWLMLRALLEGGLVLHGPARVAMLLGVGAIALTAPLAVACFARLTGIGLLGSRRTDGPGPGRDPGRAPGLSMSLPMVALALLCLAAGWFPAAPAGLLAPAVAGLEPGIVTAEAAGLLAPAVAGLEPGIVTAEAAAALRPVGLLSLGLGALIAFLLAMRWAALRRRSIRRAPTWGCGYVRPSAAMQYTGASLSQPIAHVLAPVLRTRVERAGPQGSWPAEASWRSETPDWALESVGLPAFAALSRMLARLRGLQEPRVTTYLRYVALALLVLLGLLFLPPGPRP
jgi:formate hydrogenlyase subunit 3/multisubunit Na+/H+ antiporter MnhD subunit